MGRHQESNKYLVSQNLIDFVNAISKKDESAVAIIRNDGIIVYHANKNLKYRLAKDQELVGHNIKSLIPYSDELKKAQEIIQLSINNKITTRFCFTIRWKAKDLKAKSRIIPLNKNHILVFTKNVDFNNDY